MRGSGIYRWLLRPIAWLAWASFLARLLELGGATGFLRLFLLVALLVLSWLTFKYGTGYHPSPYFSDDDE